MIELAHTAHDDTRTYRTRFMGDPLRRGIDVAYAGGADAIAGLAREYPDWQPFGSPTQAQALFLLVAPGYRADEVPLAPGAEPWLALDAAEVAEFVA